MMPRVTARDPRPRTMRAWTFDATVEAPGSARAALREFVGASAIDSGDVDAMLLCVSEAVTNAVLHAYPDGAPAADVEVEAGLFETYLALTVRDHGRGIGPRAESPGFGVGLPLIAQIASSAQVHNRASGGTEITMRFEL